MLVQRTFTTPILTFFVSFLWATMMFADVSHFDKSSIHHVYNGDEVTGYAARFILDESYNLSGVRSWWYGGKKGEKIIVKVFAQPEAATIPNDEELPVRSGEIIKQLDGREELIFAFDESLEFYGDQLIVTFSKESPDVRLLSDGYVHPVVCTDINGEELRYQYVKAEDGEWKIGQYAFLAELLGEPLGDMSEKKFNAHNLSVEFDESSLAGSLSWADINEDAYLDLLVHRKLLINVDGKTFRENKTVTSLLMDAALQLFIDVDGDADQDIIAFTNSRGFVLLNDAAGNFDLIASSLPGLRNPIAFTVCDINLDGRSDLLILDGLETDSPVSTLRVFLNLYEGWEEGQSSILHGRQSWSGSWTGLLAADVNKDRFIDILCLSQERGESCVLYGSTEGLFHAAIDHSSSITGTMIGATLIMQHGEYGTVIATDMKSALPSVMKSPMNSPQSINPSLEAFGGDGLWNGLDKDYTAAPVVGDLENDGYQDLLLANASSCFSSKLFTQSQSGLKAASADYGLELQGSMLDGLFVDYDNDGKLDYSGIVNGEIVLYHNDITKVGNYVQIEVAPGPGDADGNVREVCVYSEGQRLCTQLVSGHGLLVQGPPRIHFGLGNNKTVDSLVVKDGTGNSTSLTSVEINSLVKSPVVGAVDTETGAIGSVEASPNPLRSRSIITVNVTRDAEVTIEVFNTSQQRLAQLFDGMLAVGSHQFYWVAESAQTAEPVAAGTYFVRVSCGEQELLKKLIKID